MKQLNCLVKQRGSASTEWTIMTVIVIFALFMPVVGEGQSAMGLVMESLQGFHKHGSKMFGLP